MRVLRMPAGPGIDFVHRVAALLSLDREKAFGSTLVPFLRIRGLFGIKRKRVFWLARFPGGWQTYRPRLFPARLG
jgi:hypothetical protein